MINNDVYKIGNHVVTYEIWLAHKNEIDKYYSKIFPLFFIFFIILTIGCGVFIGEYLFRNRENDFKIGYIQACKDFHSGKLNAELKTYENGETKWIFNKDHKFVFNKMEK